MKTHQTSKLEYQNTTLAYMHLLKLAQFIKLSLKALPTSRKNADVN